MKKKKAESRKTIQKRCDKLWSKAVKIAAGHKCQMCGQDDPEKTYNSHHIVARKYKKYRWDLANGICLCYRCHKWYAHSDDYVAQLEWHYFIQWKHTNFMCERYGAILNDIIHDVSQNPKSVKPLSIYEVRKIDEALKKAVGNG